MNCFVHADAAAVGICAVCGKGACRACVGREQPRLVCVTCARTGRGLGFEWRTRASLGGLPLVHVCLARDPSTGMPKVARGVVAIGNMAVGVVAVGGLAFGLASLGGLSIGILFAFGGLAAGLGFSFGGLALGGIAVGGCAVGYQLAVGGAGFGPHVVAGTHCDPDALERLRTALPGLALPKRCGR